MHFQPNIITVCLSFILICGSSIFIYGFFPLSYSGDKIANINDLPDFLDNVPLNRSHYRRHYGQSILMIIDAFRTDFLDRNGSMEYTNSIISDKNGCLLNLKVQSPTVTMPRIKAMMTGSIPNFIDIVLNIGSTQFKGDSIINQMNQHKNRIVFCGDNTWTKLFPDQFLRHFENEDSLFVNDFYEGDRNVTKQLDLEMQKTDWDLLILHYLGLDHIGHVEGPFSDKVPSKLQEMDEIIKRIHLTANKINKLPPLLILTSDHGMRETGGHGGSSYHEINIPLILTDRRCSNLKLAYNQIDIAPSISVLFGLPIPDASIGTIIPNIVESLSKAEQLYALHYNGERLLDKLSKIATDVRQREYHRQHHEAIKNHKEYLTKADGTNDFLFKKAKRLYVASAQEMSNELANQFINFDEFCIVLGLVVVTFSFIVLLIHGINMENRMCALTISLNSFGAIVAISILSKFTICKIAFEDSGLCTENSISYLIMFALIFGVWILYQIACDRIKSLNPISVTTLHPIAVFLLSFTILHTISLSSSSYIEEEHQMWYYKAETLFIFIFLWLLRCKRIDIWRNFEFNKTTFRIFQIIATFYVEIYWFALFIMHMVMRRLNQTGDKWLSVPDVSDWLQMPEHGTWNSFFAFFGLFLMIYNCADFNGFLTNVLTLTASLLIYYYRAVSGSVNFSGIKPSDSNTPIFLFWLNIIEILAINYVPIFYKFFKYRLTADDIRISIGANITVFCLISGLLHKPHNIMLNFGILFTSFLITDAIDKIIPKGQLNWFVKTVAHFWIGKMFFFYQGNSNSLASIDLNAGYVGLKKYHMIIVGIFLTTNTFNSFVLTYLLLLYNLYGSSMNNQLSHISHSIRWIICLTTLPFTFYLYVMVLLRNHLFIWTVFSPKLLYEFYNLCLVFVITTLSIFTEKIVIGV